ncbi:MAG: bifunctional oligoribonuclease/PAP phosphatase NrnA [Atopobiaceae bacterium]|nr:bifunctional oligoribonuclease/PAP phosphatase NrnA [Atopobiaceae bacterium]
MSDNELTQELLFERMLPFIEQAQSIAICAHTDPDGDALGSGLAMGMLIKDRWPEKQISNLLADDAPVPRVLRFLPGADRLIPACNYTESPELFIAVDLPSPSRMRDGEEVMKRAAHVIVFDHHPTDTPFGDVMLTRTEAAATGVLITEFAEHLGFEITPAIATCLYCAVATDTGRFQFQNSDVEAFEVASRLVAAGARPDEIAYHVYQSDRIEYLHLEAIVMGRILTTEQGRIAYSFVRLADLEATGAQSEECDGLIDVVRSVAGSEVCLVLKERPDGSVRANLRSKGKLDVSGVAREFGGGGHKAAAGFTRESTIEEILTELLPRLQELVRAGDLSGDTRAFPKLEID